MADDQHDYKVGPGRKTGKTGRTIEQMLEIARHIIDRRPNAAVQGAESATRLIAAEFRCGVPR
jgi:hypothetical protein